MLKELSYQLQCYETSKKVNANNLIVDLASVKVGIYTSTQNKSNKKMRSSAIISNILQKPIGCFPLILPLEIFNLTLNKHWFDILFEFQFVKFDESELKTPFFGLFWTEI